MAGIPGVLDEVERRPTIGQRLAKFAVEVGVLRRQAGDRLGQRGVLVRPIISSAGQDLYATGIEPSVHAIAVELDLVDQSAPSGASLTSAAGCGFTQVGKVARSTLRRAGVVVEAIWF